MSGSLSTQPLVSVVIPTRNAGPQFERVLQAIHQQRTSKAEIVIVDSGSTDGTLALGERFGARIIPILPEQFNHGETRNLGIEQSQGELVVCLTQDAQPADQDWLNSLVEALKECPQAAGAYSRQLPWPEDDALTQFLVHQWYRVQGRGRVVQTLPQGTEFASVPYSERRRICAFDNVSSILRREVWEQYPFRSVTFAEDIDWAKRVILAGHQIVYEPSSMIYHSHTRPFSYNLRRQYIDERVALDLLEADDATVRSWSGPCQAGGLALSVLREAKNHDALSPGVLWRTSAFSLAVMLGSLTRRAIHPQLRASNPPEWVHRVDARLVSGI